MIKHPYNKGARRFAAAEISNSSWGDQVLTSLLPLRSCYALVVPLREYVSAGLFRSLTQLDLAHHVFKTHCKM